MHQCLRELHQDHLNLSRVLQVLERQLADIEAGGRIDLHLLGEIVDYVRSYPDLIHHPREDVILRRYRERFPEVRELVDRVMEQHLELRQRTLVIKDTLQQCWQDSPVPREYISRLIGDYLRLQWEHLDLEEGEVYRLVERGLTEADWNDIDRAMPVGSDPLFDDLLRKGYENIFMFLTDIEPIGRLVPQQMPAVS